MEKTYKTLKIVLFALVFVALLLGAKRLYDTLGSQVQLDTLATQAAQTSQETQSAQAEGTEPAKQLAPDFTVYDLEGNSHKLSDFRGKPVILNFWASWCGPCKMEMPDFDEKYQTYADQVHFLMVNLTDGSQETVETASSFIEEQGYTFPVYFDSDYSGAIAYGVNAVPVTYFIDEDGGFVARQQGVVGADTLQKGIDLLLAD